MARNEIMYIFYFMANLQVDFNLPRHPSFFTLEDVFIYSGKVLIYFYIKKSIFVFPKCSSDYDYTVKTLLKSEVAFFL